MALKAGYKGIKKTGPGLEYDNVTGELKLNGESDLKLDNLEDVSIDTPLGGDVLMYDSTNEEWVNETPDTTPTEDSSELITSGGVYGGLADLWSSNARTGVHNLLPNTASSTGIFTVNSDGSVTVNGSPSSNVYLRLYTFEAGTLQSGNYILSGCPEGGSATTYELQLYDSTLSSAVANNFGGDTLVTIDGTHKYGVLIYGRNGATITNKLFKPMLRVASDTDTTYTPYAMTNGELTEIATLKKTDTFGQVNATKRNGMCMLSFTGTSVTNEDGKTLGTLGDEYKPLAEYLVSAQGYNGSAYVDTIIKITTGGVVTVQSTGGTAIAGIQPNLVLTRPVYLAKES